MQRLAHVVLVALLTAWFAPKVAFAARAETPAAEHQPAPTPAPASPSERNAYEARAMDARALEDFRGGGVSIYIGSGVLVAIIAVLLLIILL